MQGYEDLLELVYDDQRFQSLWESEIIEDVILRMQNEIEMDLQELLDYIQVRSSEDGRVINQWIVRDYTQNYVALKLRGLQVGQQQSNQDCQNKYDSWIMPLFGSIQKQEKWSFKDTIVGILKESSIKLVDDWEIVFQEFRDQSFSSFDDLCFNISNWANENVQLLNDANYLNEIIDKINDKEVQGMYQQRLNYLGQKENKFELQTQIEQYFQNKPFTQESILQFINHVNIIRNGRLGNQLITENDVNLIIKQFKQLNINTIKPLIDKIAIKIFDNDTRPLHQKRSILYEWISKCLKLQKVPLISRTGSLPSKSFLSPITKQTQLLHYSPSSINQLQSPYLRPQTLQTSKSIAFKRQQKRVNIQTLRQTEQNNLNSILRTHNAKIARSQRVLQRNKIFLNNACN